MSQTLEIAEDLVEEIVRRILSVAEVDRIILFGSAASGKMGPDSDIDLLVLENAPGNIRREMVRFRGALRGLSFPFDVLVMSTERFEESKSVVGSIAHPANKYGRVVYGAA